MREIWYAPDMDKRLSTDPDYNDAKSYEAQIHYRCADLTDELSPAETFAESLAEFVRRLTEAFKPLMTVNEK